jgi:ferredoxin
VDCFKIGPNFLVIDPNECIDCAVCVPECPVNAIYSEEDLPEDQKDFLEINARLSDRWPVINRKREALSDADQWANVNGKKGMIEE